MYVYTKMNNLTYNNTKALNSYICKTNLKILIYIYKALLLLLFMISK